MAVKNMPAPDATLKKFFMDNDVFAALFNGYFFQGHTVVQPSELKSVDTAYAATVRQANGKKIKITKYRDIARQASIGKLIILGIENQDKIHYAMPVRNMLYDALGYTSELDVEKHTRDAAAWTIDEYLSGVRKETKIAPIVTVVFYTGENEWDGPRCLHDLLDLNEVQRRIVPDYPLYIIDLAHDKQLSFPNGKLTELKEALSSLYEGRAETDTTMVGTDILALTGILAGDTRLYKEAVNQKEGGRIMLCNALKERDERIFADVNKQLADVNKQLAEKDASIAEKEASIAEQAASLAEKDAYIKKLEALLELKEHQPETIEK